MRSETLTTTIRASLEGAGSIREIKMFGGIGFMLNGNMVAAASKRGLLARTGEEQQNLALKIEGAKPMVMRGRIMRDYIYLKPPHLSVPTTRRCMKLAIAFVLSLPPNAARAKSNASKKVPRKPASHIQDSRVSSKQRLSKRR
jgi:TfoX/Sxy family transcriptional regulator of competence genes